MRRLFCIAVFFCFAVSFCLTPRSLFSEEGEKETLLKKLIDAREEWMENASFYGHCTARSAEFASEEEALTAELPAGADRESGFLAKLNRRYRWQSLSGSEEDPKNAVFIDSVSNDRFRLNIDRRPKSERFKVPYSGILYKLSFDPKDGANAAVNAAVADSDYAPWVFFAPDIYRFVENAADGSDFEYAPLEDGRVRLTFSEERSDDVRLSTSLTVRTDSDRPVVEQIVRAVDNPMMTVIIVIKALEWKECGGFSVPVRIRRASFFGPAPDSKESAWNAVEWVSDDLGVRPPRESDFAVTVKFGDFILHLKKPWWKRTVRIDALADKNYDPEIPDFVTDPEKSPPPKYGVCFRWACAAAGLALVALALILKYRARKKKTVSV